MFILDCQGFQYSTSNFLCKEIAIINIENGCVFHQMFEPLIPTDLLNNNFKKQIQWNTNNIHGLSWENALKSNNDNPIKLPFESISMYIKLIVKNDIVYVKGLEKKTWLARIIANNIIDLSELGCMSLDSLRSLNLDSFTHHCKNHLYNHLRCAKQNVCLLRRWFKEH